MEKIEKKEFLEKKLAEGYPADMMKLAAEDLEYGLPTGQIEIYLDKEYSIRQARLMSDCMRDEKLTGLLIVIQHQNVFRMELAKKYYKLGLSLMAIDEAIRETTDAYTMGKKLAKVYEEKEASDREARIRELLEAAKKIEAMQAAKAEGKSEAGSTDFDGNKSIGGIEYMVNTIGGLIPVEVMPVSEMGSRTMSLATLFRTRNHPRRDIFKVIARKKLSVEQMEQVSLGVEVGLSDHQIRLILAQERTPDEIAELVKTAVDLNHRPLV